MTKNRGVHLPDELDEALRVEAAYRGVSVHRLMLDVLEREAMVWRHVRPVPADTTDPPGDLPLEGHHSPVQTTEHGDPPLGEPFSVPADATKGKTTGRVFPYFDPERHVDKPVCTRAPAERRLPKGKLGPHKIGCPAREV